MPDQRAIASRLLGTGNSRRILLRLLEVADRKTQQHILRLSGGYAFRDNLSLNLDYQYFHYESDNWAIDDLQTDTLDKVLSFGEESPDEGINYLGLSVQYKLR